MLRKKEGKIVKIIKNKIYQNMKNKNLNTNKNIKNKKNKKKKKKNVYN